MINNLPKQYKSNFWEKFRALFIKNNYKENTIKINEKIEKSNSFKEKLNINRILKDNETKTQILKITEENPELLEILNIEKLEKISKIYDEKIEEATIRLNNLKQEFKNKIGQS